MNPKEQATFLPEPSGQSQRGEDPNSHGKKNTNSPFQRLGEGRFAAVFAHPTEPVVYKRGLKTDGQQCLWNMVNEYTTHQHISAAFHKWSVEDSRVSGIIDVQVQVPQPQKLILEDYAWWALNASRFPADDVRYQRPAPTLVAERIPRLSTCLQRQIVDHSDPANPSLKIDTVQDAMGLIPLVLGKRLRDHTSEPDSKSNSGLRGRDISSHVHRQLLQGLDTKFVAAQFGKAFAILHFEACTNAKGVEFVLGKARNTLVSLEAACPSIAPWTNRNLQKPSMADIQGSGRMLSIWCLDFDQCQHLAFDSHATLTASLELCVSGYFLSDPYCPRPDQPELWDVFKVNYEATANQVLHAHLLENTRVHEAIMILWGYPHFPRTFLQTLEQRFWEKKANNLL